MERDKPIRIHSLLFPILAFGFFISCNSQIEIDHYGQILKSQSLNLDSVSNDIERIIQLKYTASNDEIATRCSVHNLEKLEESTNCKCANNGNCTVGITPLSGETGKASFEYTVYVEDNASNTSSVSYELAPASSSGLYYLYSSNNTSGNISITSYDTNSNELNFIENDNLAPTSPEKMAVVGNNFYLAGNWLDNKISHYKIDPSSGLLTKQLDYTDAIDPRTLVVKDNKFLYMANFLNPGKINKYEIAADGSLSNHSQTDATGSKPRAIALHPTLDILYLPNMWTWNIYEYSINSATGNLTEGSSISAPNDPNWIEVNSDGTFAFVTNANNLVLVYSIHPVTGALTHVNNYSTQGSGPYMVKLNSDSSCLYINNITSKELAKFSHNLGVPSYISSETYAQGLGEIIIEGDKLFASSMDGKIRAYNIESDCDLTLEDEIDTGGDGAYGLSIYKP